MNFAQPNSRRQQSAESLAECGELFTPNPEVDQTPGSFNDEFVIRGLITQSIKGCDKSRMQIAEEMSSLLGTQVTKRALDSYTSESADQNRFPVQYTRAFCFVTGDWSLLRCVTERAGLHVISKAERKLLELGRQYMIEKRAALAIEKLEIELQGVAL